ncbi:MAG: hypothetical protein ACLFS3_03395 [Candidatus Aenigmatarchaeota archaeon]
MAFRDFLFQITVACLFSSLVSLFLASPKMKFVPYRWWIVAVFGLASAAGIVYVFYQIFSHLNF